MQNKKIKLLLLLISSWVVGLFIILVGGRIFISLASYFLSGDFDFYRNDLVRAAEISIGCGVIIGVGQCLMSKEKPSSPSNPE
ncbi:MULTISPECIES: hypothetical protein [Pantoea]|uniref:DUF2975 domain-containing protein n=2 Tax=Erwiniaceae TaxID=1903409 RepID=A0ABY2Z7E3_9GAMM|nr:MULTISPECIES: hypothetical protein [Pantoea]KAA5994503.1 hypothetical protein F3I47_05775 [Pantoea sp. M_10]KAF6662186.1 hypothetical protein HFD91_01065 [Enterobacteriaceae bacterium EKM102V]TPE18683.1 hypothetical protein FJP62_01100 [Pantoea vagans]KAA5973506.1 hypothetical protein F3I51_08695 [Pantoea sp. M_6]KAA5980821.1 hypothetical protein F3I52_02700 [Pantoea sp. M_8]